MLSMESREGRSTGYYIRGEGISLGFCGIFPFMFFTFALLSIRLIDFSPAILCPVLVTRSFPRRDRDVAEEWGESGSFPPSQLVIVSSFHYFPERIALPTFPTLRRFVAEGSLLFPAVFHNVIVQSSLISLSCRE